MQIENKVQEIATTTATTAAQDFLNTLPPEVSQALCLNFLSSLSADVQADLQAVIYSRLQWSLQALKAELRENASASSEVPTKPVPRTKPQPLPVPAVQARRKHVLIPKSTPRKQAKFSSTPIPISGLNNDPPSQLELPITAESEPLKPYQRRRGKEPQLTREEIMKFYSLSPDDFTPRPAEAVRRRRRTSIAMS